MRRAPRFPRRMPQAWASALCATVFCAALALAWWQHRRAESKQQMQDVADSQLAEKPLAGGAAVRASREELGWRRAALAGTYDGAGQFLIDNRSLRRRPGYHVIAPLSLAAGGWALVNRGWIPVAARREQAAAPAAPAGLVTVAGVLVTAGRAGFSLGGPNIEGKIWQRLAIGQWQRRTGRQALPAVLVASDSAAGVEAVAARPDFRARTSRGYRLQWLGLAAVVAVGWMAAARALPKSE